MPYSSLRSPGQQKEEPKEKQVESLRGLGLRVPDDATPEDLQKIEPVAQRIRERSLRQNDMASLPSTGEDASQVDLSRITSDPDVQREERAATLRRQRSVLGQGLAASGASLQASVPGTAGLVAGALGFEDKAVELADRAAVHLERAAEVGPQTSLRDVVEGDGKFSEWAVGAIGMQAPILATFFVGGGVGGLAGRAVHAGRLQGAQGMAAGSQLASAKARLAYSQAQRQAQGRVVELNRARSAHAAEPTRSSAGRIGGLKRQMQAAPERIARQRATADATRAQAVLDRQTRMRVALAKGKYEGIGAAVGATATGVPLYSSETSQWLIDPEASGSIQKRALTGLGGATMASIASIAPTIAALRNVGMASSAARQQQMAMQSGLRRIPTAAGKQAVYEGSAEGVAELSKTWAHTWINDNIDMFSSDQLWHYYEAMAVGGMLGAGMGAATATRARDARELGQWMMQWREPGPVSEALAEDRAGSEDEQGRRRAAPERAAEGRVFDALPSDVQAQFADRDSFINERVKQKARLIALGNAVIKTNELEVNDPDSDPVNIGHAISLLIDPRMAKVADANVAKKGEAAFSMAQAAREDLVSQFGEEQADALIQSGMDFLEAQTVGEIQALRGVLNRTDDPAVRQLAQQQIEELDQLAAALRGEERAAQSQEGQTAQQEEMEDMIGAGRAAEASARVESFPYQETPRKGAKRAGELGSYWVAENQNAFGAAQELNAPIIERSRRGLEGERLAEFDAQVAETKRLHREESKAIDRLANLRRQMRADREQGMDLARGQALAEQFEAIEESLAGIRNQLRSLTEVPATPNRPIRMDEAAQLQGLEGEALLALTNEINEQQTAQKRKADRLETENDALNYLSQFETVVSESADPALTGADTRSFTRGEVEGFIETKEPVNNVNYVPVHTKEGKLVGYVNLVEMTQKMMRRGRVDDLEATAKNEQEAERAGKRFEEEGTTDGAIGLDNLGRVFRHAVAALEEHGIMIQEGNLGAAKEAFRRGSREPVTVGELTTPDGPSRTEAQLRAQANLPATERQLQRLEAKIKETKRKIKDAKGQKAKTNLGKALTELERKKSELRGRKATRGSAFSLLKRIANTKTIKDAKAALDAALKAENAKKVGNKKRVKQGKKPLSLFEESKAVDQAKAKLAELRVAAAKAQEERIKAEIKEIEGAIEAATTHSETAAQLLAKTKRRIGMKQGKNQTNAEYTEQQETQRILAELLEAKIDGKTTPLKKAKSELRKAQARLLTMVYYQRLAQQESNALNSRDPSNYSRKAMLQWLKDEVRGVNEPSAAESETFKSAQLKQLLSEAGISREDITGRETSWVEERRDYLDSMVTSLTARLNQLTRGIASGRISLSPPNRLQQEAETLADTLREMAEELGSLQRSLDAVAAERKDKAEFDPAILARQRNKQQKELQAAVRQAEKDLASAKTKFEAKPPKNKSKRKTLESVVDQANSRLRAAKAAVRDHLVRRPEELDVEQTVLAARNAANVLDALLRDPGQRGVPPTTPAAQVDKSKPVQPQKEVKTKLDRLVEQGKATLRDGVFYVKERNATNNMAGTTRSGQIYVNIAWSREQSLAGYISNSQQKQAMLQGLGVSAEQFASLFGDQKRINAFLRDHERSHLKHRDLESYPRDAKGGFDLMHPDAIAIETRATLDALTAEERTKLEGMAQTTETAPQAETAQPAASTPAQQTTTAARAVNQARSPNQEQRSNERDYLQEIVKGLKLPKLTIRGVIPYAEALKRAEAKGMDVSKSDGLVFMDLNQKTGEITADIWVKESITGHARLGVLHHELGHAVAQSMAYALPTADAVAIVNEFMQWRAKHKPGSRSDAIKSKRSFLNVMAYRKGDTAMLQNLSEAERNNVLDFQEWMADNIGRWVETNKRPRGVVEKFFKAIADQLKALMAKFKGKGMPAKSVREALNRLWDAQMPNDAIRNWNMWARLEGRSAFEDRFKGKIGDVVQLIEEQIDKDAGVNPERIAQGAVMGNETPFGPEGFWAARDMILAKLTPKERNTLARALNIPRIARQIEQAIDKLGSQGMGIPDDGISVMAYGYQLWAAGQLDVTPKAGAVYRGISTFTHRVMGKLMEHEQALEILQAIQDDRITARDGRLNEIFGEKSNIGQGEYVLERALVLSLNDMQRKADELGVTDTGEFFQNELAQHKVFRSFPTEIRNLIVEDMEAGAFSDAAVERIGSMSDYVLNPEKQFLTREIIGDEGIHRAARAVHNVLTGAREFMIGNLLKLVGGEALVSRATKNAGMTRITNALTTDVLREGSGEGFINAKDRRIGQYNTRWERIVEGLSAAHQKELQGAYYDRSQASSPQVKRALNQIDALFRELLTYARNAGIQVSAVKGEYRPWVFDAQKMHRHSAKVMEQWTDEIYRKDWFDLYAKHMPEKVGLAKDFRDDQQYRDYVQSWISSIVHEHGFADSARVDPDGVQTNPYAANLGARELDFLRTNPKAPKEHHDLRNQLFSDDLNTTMAGYIGQVVKKAEYVRRFGRHDEKLNQMLGQIKDFGGTARDVEIARNMVKSATGRHGLEVAAFWKMVVAPINKGLKTVYNERGEPFASQDQAEKHRIKEGVTGTAVEAEGGWVIRQDVTADPRRFRNAMSWLTVYQNYRLLIFAAFTNLADIAGIPLRTGDLGVALRAYKLGAKHVMDSIRDRKLPAAERRARRSSLERLAEEWGIIAQTQVAEALGLQYGGVHMTGKAKEWNDKLFRFNKMEFLTRTTRLMATSAALESVAYHGQRGSLGEAASVDFLAELGLTPDQVKRGGDGKLQLLSVEDTAQLLEGTGLTVADAREAIRQGSTDPRVREVARDEEVKRALFRMVDESVLRPQSIHRPTWMNDPNWMLFSHLKGFMYTYHERVLRRVVGKGIESNFAPLALASIYVGVMMGADWLREIVQWGWQGDERKARWGPRERLADGVHRSGVLGMYTVVPDMMKTHEFGRSKLAQLGGTTTSQIEQWYRALAGPGQLDVAARRAMPASQLWYDVPVNWGQWLASGGQLSHQDQALDVPIIRPEVREKLGF